MRVLYVVERFWPLIGGLEVISARLVRALAQRGHEIEVVTSREQAWMPATEPYGPVTVRRLPFVRGLNDRNVDLLAESRAGMNAIIRDLRPQLIHASFTAPALWLLPRTKPAPVIVALHGPWRRVDYTVGLSGRVVGSADWVTACSQHTLDHLLETAAPEVAQRASVLLNGLDATFAGDPPEPPPGTAQLLCSGRLELEKGIDLAIAAFSRLTDLDVHLAIAGDGSVRPALEAQVAALGLTDRVTFRGWISPDRAHELVAQATIVLIPSRSEGFGLTALEAALMARPVVASDTGGLRESVAAGTTGLVVPSDDVAAIEGAIRKLLADPAYARSLGNAGRVRAQALFGAERHLNEWDALYRRIGTGD